MAEGGAPGKDDLPGFGIHLQKDGDGNTPLHIAARAGSTDVIRALLTLGAEGLEERNKLGQTPLYLAVASGDKEAVASLLEAGADIGAVADDGSTIWHAAASSGDTEVIKLIAKFQLAEDNSEKKIDAKGRRISKMKNDSAIDSKKEPHKLVTKAELPDKNARISKKENISSDKSPQTLSEQINELKYNTQLNTKCLPQEEKRKLSKTEEQHIKVNNVCLTSDSEDDISHKKSPEERKYKNEKLVAPTRELHIVDIVQEKLFTEERKKFFNSITQMPINADVASHLLIEAAIHGADKFVEHLLKLNPDVNIKYKQNGATPFLLASASGSERMMDMLLDAGADYKQEDAYGRTALHLAANKGNLVATKKLLALGLDPNKKSNGGHTPLHVAAMAAGNALIVKQLLKHGADKLIEDNSGRTPLEYAFKSNDIGLITVIHSYGSR